jgi:hypothetical protein
MEKKQIEILNFHFHIQSLSVSETRLFGLSFKDANLITEISPPPFGSLVLPQILLKFLVTIFPQVLTNKRTKTLHQKHFTGTTKQTES